MLIKIFALSLAIWAQSNMSSADRYPASEIAEKEEAVTKAVKSTGDSSAAESDSMDRKKIRLSDEERAKYVQSILSGKDSAAGPNNSGSADVH